MIHPTAIFFGRENITFGKNVRIDCYCVIAAGEKGMHIGDYVHLSPHATIHGSSGRVHIGNFCSLSTHSIVFTAIDNLTSGHLMNPCVDDEFRDVKTGDVIFENHATLAAGSIVLPGVTLGRGSCVGALSMVKHDVQPYNIVVGHNQRVIGQRNAELMARLERECVDKYK